MGQGGGAGVLRGARREERREEEKKKGASGEGREARHGALGLICLLGGENEVAAVASTTQQCGWLEEEDNRKFSHRQVLEKFSEFAKRPLED